MFGMLKRAISSAASTIYFIGKGIALTVTSIGKVFSSAGRTAHFMPDFLAKTTQLTGRILDCELGTPPSQATIGITSAAILGNLVTIGVTQIPAVWGYPKSTQENGSQIEYEDDSDEETEGVHEEDILLDDTDFDCEENRAESSEVGDEDNEEISSNYCKRATRWVAQDNYHGWGYDEELGYLGTLIYDAFKVFSLMSSGYVGYNSRFFNQVLSAFIVNAFIGLTEEEQNENPWFSNTTSIISIILSLTIGYTYYKYTKKRADDNAHEFARCVVTGHIPHDKFDIATGVIAGIGMLSSPFLGHTSTYDAFIKDGFSELTADIHAGLSAFTSTTSYMMGFFPATNKLLRTIFGKERDNHNQYCFVKPLNGTVCLFIAIDATTTAISYFMGTEKILAAKLAGYKYYGSMGIAGISALCNGGVSFAFSHEGYSEVKKGIKCCKPKREYNSVPLEILSLPETDVPLSVSTRVREKRELRAGHFEEIRVCRDSASSSFFRDPSTTLIELANDDIFKNENRENTSRIIEKLGN